MMTVGIVQSLFLVRLAALRYLTPAHPLRRYLLWEDTDKAIS
jgi:hypothetical protein